LVHAIPVPQTTPQLPQFEGLLRGSMQPVPQSRCVPGQAHMPFAQPKPAPQGWLHMPQWAISVAVFTQLLPHGDRPEAQVALHMPSEQKSPAGQALPHAPQLAPSDIGLMQAPLGHAVSPA
jgi:hypothetical protein